MAPCTHPGASSGVNEGRGGLILAVGRVRSQNNDLEEKNTSKYAPPKAHHDIYSILATATTSKRCAMKHVQRVSPCSIACTHPGFVEIGLVQLLQMPTEKTASVASFPRPVFLFDSSLDKRGNERTNHRHQQSSQRPPQVIPLFQNCEAVLGKVPDPLGARGNILLASAGSAPTWSQRVDDFRKSAILT